MCVTNAIIVFELLTISVPIWKSHNVYTQTERHFFPLYYKFIWVSPVLSFKTEHSLKSIIWNDVCRLLCIRSSSSFGYRVDMRNSKIRMNHVDFETKTRGAIVFNAGIYYQIWIWFYQRSSCLNRPSFDNWRWSKSCTTEYPAIL